MTWFFWLDCSSIRFCFWIVIRSHWPQDRWILYVHLDTSIRKTPMITSTTSVYIYIYRFILYFIFAYTAIAHVLRKYICCTNNSIFAGLKPCGCEVYSTSWNGFGLLQHHELCIVWLFVQCVWGVFQSYKTPLDRKPVQGMSGLVGLRAFLQSLNFQVRFNMSKQLLVWDL